MANDGNVIDEMSVRFTADVSQMAVDIERGMNEAAVAVEAGATEIEQAIEYAFAFIPDGMQVMIKDAMDMMNTMGYDLAQTATFIANAYDLTEQEVVSAVTNTMSMMEQAIEITKEGYRLMGEEIPFPELKKLENQMQKILDLGLEMGIPMRKIGEEMWKAAEAAIPPLELTQAELAHLAQALNLAEISFEAMGQKIPFPELKKLQTALIKLIKLARDMKASDEELWEEMANSIEKIVPKMEEMTQAQQKGIPQVNQGLKQQSGMLSGILGKLGGIAAGYLTFRTAAKFINESVQAAEVATEQTVLLTLAVREHQRAVGEQSPTVREAIQQAERLSDTYGIQRGAARQLVTESMNMTRNLKLNAEQLASMQESAVILGETMGIDVVRSMQILTDFMTTGHTAALEQLGFTLDETSLRVEAIQRGYIDYGEELDENTMRLVALALVEERAAESKQDLIDADNTRLGQLESQNIELDKQKEILGKFLLPLWQQIQITGAKGLTALTQLLTVLTIKLFEFFVGVISFIQSFADMIQTFQDIGFEGVMERGGFATVREEAMVARQKENQAALQEAFRGFLEAGSELGDETAENLDKAGRAYEDFADKVDAAADDYAMSMKKFQAAYDKDFAAAQRRLDDELARIDQQFKDRREKMGLDLAHSLEDINRRARERRERTTRDHYNDTEKALADHQLRMRRLEEDYIFDLQDAVRERDARAVLDLRRRYNMDKRRAEEDFKIRDKRRKQDLALELVEIEQQRLLKRNQRIEAFNEEIVQLAEQEELRKQQALDAFDRRIRDLNDKYGEMLRQEGAFLAESIGLNAEHANELFNLLESMYGDSGFVVAFIEGINEYLAAQNLVLPGVSMGSTGYESGLANPEGLSQAEMRGRSAGVQRQRGGTLFATSPQMIQVGETPERVDITRLSASTGRQRDGGRGGGPIEIRLNVDADEGLKVEVADYTMNEIAEVFVTIDKKATGQVRRN